MEKMNLIAIIVAMSACASVNGITSYQSTNTTITYARNYDTRRQHALKGDGEINEVDGSRNEVIHKPYVTAVMTSPIHHGRPNPCYFKRCYPGQKCVIDGLSGRATCICKRHCKPINKPVCGTDGEYYINRCEMHKSSCVNGNDVYDARHKDCFYKKTACGAVDFNQFQDILLQYQQTAIAPTRHDDVKENEERSRQKRSALGRSHHHKKSRKHNGASSGKAGRKAKESHFEASLRNDDVVIVPLAPSVNDDNADINDDVASTPAEETDEQTDINDEPQIENDDDVIEEDILDETVEEAGNDVQATHAGNDETVDQADETSPMESEIPSASPALYDDRFASEDRMLDDVYDDIITSDVRGDAVKFIYKFMDLDEDGIVGSEEIYELSLMEDLDAIFPPSCSLFHLLHYADENDDNSMDIHELLKIYNITILNLPDEEKTTYKAALYGESVTLQCGIQGEPNPIWRRHGYDLAVYGEESIRVDGTFVRFAEAHPRHAGNYTCHARMRTDIFQVIKLSIHAGPYVEIYPRTQHRSTGSSVTVICHVTGVPTPQITWLVNGEDLDVESGRYLLLENNTELHINSAVTSDSAAYSCVATNAAGNHEEIGAVFVEDDVSASDSSRNDVAVYFVFYEDGIMIMEPRSCQILRKISSSETMPGLLRQNKLCREYPNDGGRRCKWSVAVSVGSRFVYAAQPEENRIVVVDMRLQRVVEVLATDPLPVSLQYVRSTGQLFVSCWVDPSRERSTLQVIYGASIPGIHSAAQIQPLDGGNAIDFSVFNFFVPPEGAMNEVAKHGFIAHKNQRAIYKLDLSTLLYDDDIINLEPYDCAPSRFAYQPIGGRLDVTCVSEEGESPRSLTVEYASGRVVPMEEDTRYNREYVSMDSRHVIRIFPTNQMIKIFNVTETGDLIESIDLHTNFMVSDAVFEGKLSTSDAAAVYVSSQVQGDIMYVDASTGNVEVIDNVMQPVSASDVPWSSRNRPLVKSSWYDRHIATAGINEIEIIDVGTNDVSCRVNDVTHATAIVWADGRK